MLEGEQSQPNSSCALQCIFVGVLFEIKLDFVLQRSQQNSLSRLGMSDVFALMRRVGIWGAWCSCSLHTPSGAWREKGRTPLDAGGGDLCWFVLLLSLPYRHLCETGRDQKWVCVSLPFPIKAKRWGNSLNLLFLAGILLCGYR